MKTNIYLDIDGVLVDSSNQPAPYAHDFLVYITSHFTVYWLTTHCRGDFNATNNYLKMIFPQATLKIIQGILPTNWMTTKTEAIDFSQPFLWFDDYLFQTEKQVLMDHNVLENWIAVDLRKDNHQLLKFIKDFPMPINGL